MSIEFVPILCPTRTLQGMPAMTMFNLCTTIAAMGKHPYYVQACGAGYAHMRTEVFKLAKRNLHTLMPDAVLDEVRGFMLDDDILLTDSKKLLKAVQTANAEAINIVAPYNFEDGTSSICEMHPRFRRKTCDEAAAITDYTLIQNAGLGFYYGRLHLEYTFHENGRYNGEDLNYFYDNGMEDEISCVQLGLRHLKTVAL